MMSNSTEIRDDRPFELKAKLVSKGLVCINGYLSKEELCKCLELLKNPDEMFIGEVESTSNLKVKIKVEDTGYYQWDPKNPHFKTPVIPKKYFIFYIIIGPLYKSTISEVEGLDAAKAFFKGYLAYNKVQERSK